MSTARPTPTDTWSLSHLLATMAPLLAVLSVLELSSGAVLSSLESTYLGNPTLLLLVPVMIGTGGNLGAIVAARLSTRLHLGTLSLSPRDEALQETTLAILALALTVFSALAVLAYAVGHVLGSTLAFGTLFVISVVSGLTLAVLAVAIAVGTTAIAYRRGLDPDDVTIPVVTNLCDVLGIVILSGVAIAVL